MKDARSTKPYFHYKTRYKLRGSHDFEFVLTTDARLLTWKEVSVLQIADDAGEFIDNFVGKILSRNQAPLGGGLEQAQADPAWQVSR